MLTHEWTVVVARLLLIYFLCYLLHRFHTFTCGNKTLKKGTCFSLSDAQWFFLLWWLSVKSQWNNFFYFTVWNTSFYFTFIITLFLLLSLGGYLCWWTISPWGYHSLSSLGFYHWVDTSVSGLLVPGGIIYSVVWASPRTWFIRYIYYWNLLFLNNVIINETKVVFPQT